MKAAAIAKSQVVPVVFALIVLGVLILTDNVARTAAVAERVEAPWITIDVFAVEGRPDPEITWTRHVSLDLQVNWSVEVYEVATDRQACQGTGEAHMLASDPETITFSLSSRLQGRKCPLLPETIYAMKLSLMAVDTKTALAKNYSITSNLFSVPRSEVD